MEKMSRSEAGRLGAIKTNRLRVQRYEHNPKLCKHCKEKLPYQKRQNTFCDNSCSASYNNLGMRRHGESESKIKINVRYPKELEPIFDKDQICEYCKIVFHRNKVRKYCSLVCQQNFIWTERKVQIEQSGRENSVRCAKRYLLEIRGCKCEVCGNTEWQGKPIPLVMDHIDGNSENNELINLRLVCGNCDMQLPTYKSKNKGKGRAFRRKRYANGQSY